METYSIKFITEQSSKAITKEIRAKDTKEAIQKLKEIHQDAFIVSYQQM